MRSFALYGKGGSGKSTIAAALSSCLADAGRSVLHIGCDPKADSSRLLVRGPVATVMETAHGTDLYDASCVLLEGIKGITCVEAGGPEPGVGCGGRAITRAFEVLDELGVSLSSYDVVVFDVLGDVVCGGFALPMRSGYAQQVAIVVSGTERSLFAANNLLKAALRFRRNGVTLAGLVANSVSAQQPGERVERFARATGTEVLARVPFDPVVLHAEEQRQTVCDLNPGAPAALAIEELSKRLVAVVDAPAPNPLSAEAFDRFIADNPHDPATGAEG